MFSYTDGRPIARFISGPNKGLKTIKFIKKAKNLKRKPLGRDIKVDGKLSIIPNTECEREVIYIAGPSGAGKSSIVADYVTTFKKVFKNVPVIIFSRKKSDPVLDKLKISWFPMDEGLYDDPIDITTDIGNNGALMIFDDCNTFSDKKIKKAINALICDVLEVGRQYKIYCIITNHLINANERDFNRTVFDELHTLIVFPKTGTIHQIEYALKKYFGMKSDQIDKINNLNTRWVAINKGNPKYCLHKKGAFII